MAPFDPSVITKAGDSDAVPELLKKINLLADKEGDEARQNMKDLARDLFLSLETPREAMIRQCWAEVCQLHSSLLLLCITREPCSTSSLMPWNAAACRKQHAPGPGSIPVQLLSPANRQTYYRLKAYFFIEPHLHMLPYARRKNYQGGQIH